LTSNEALARIINYHNEAFLLKRALLDYNWEYRRKICVKCTAEQQIKLHCLKVDNFVGGIQETHCRKLVRARTEKFKKIMGEGLIESQNYATTLRT
jgi:hypothetical protein